MAQLVKNLPAMPETWVRFLGWEDTLEKGKTTHSSILAWRDSMDCIVTKNQTQLSNFHFSLSDKMIKYPVTPSLIWPLKMLGGFRREGI